MSKKIRSEKEAALIVQLEKLGWRYAYLSGHGDSECAFDEVDNKWLVVADVEKCMILCPPESIAKTPWEY